MTEPWEADRSTDKVLQTLRKLYEIESSSITDEVHTGGGRLSDRAYAVGHAITAIEREAELRDEVRDILHDTRETAEQEFANGRTEAAYVLRELADDIKAALSRTGGES